MSTLAGNPNYQICIVQNSTKTSVKDINVTAYMPDKFMWSTSSNYDTPFAQGLLGSGKIATAAALFGYRMVTPAMTAAIWTGSANSELTLSLEFFAEADTYNDVTGKVLDSMRLVTPNLDKASGLITSPGPQLSLVGAVNVATSAASSISSGLRGLLGNDSTVAGLVDSAASGLLKFIPKDMNDSNTQTNGELNKTRTTQQLSLGSGDAWKSNVDNKISIKIGNYAFFDCVVITKVQQTYSSLLDSNGKPTHAIVELSFKPMFIVTQEDIDLIFLNPKFTNGV